MLFTRKSKETNSAIEESYSNANQDWRVAAENTLWKLCLKKRFLTSDDVIAQLELKGAKTHNNSALGGVFLKAKNSGWIAPYGYEPSRRRSRHQAPIRVWKSLIVKGGKNVVS